MTDWNRTDPPLNTNIAILDHDNQVRIGSLMRVVEPVQITDHHGNIVEGRQPYVMTGDINQHPDDIFSVMAWREIEPG